MALTGVGVCSKCETALAADGYPEAAAEIKRVAAREWRGDRTQPGSPANIMARLRYDLFLTKGFEPTFWEQARTIATSDGVKELVKFAYAALLAWLVYKTGWKK